MEQYFFILVIIGFLGFASSWLPFITKKLNISYSIVFLAIGWITYSLFGNSLPWPSPFKEQDITVKLTELLVVIALMGTGLRIDRKFSFSRWRAPLRLVGIYMLMSAAAITAVFYYFLETPLAVALLAGAMTAPTDPVLASDVQSGPPNSKDEDDIRFSLTAEAGLNDGLAFPLTWLAISCAQAKEGEPFLWSWFEFDVLWRLLSGGALGYLIGKGVTTLFFKLPERYKAYEVRDGLVALSASLFTYGVTELFNGYGFIAVFICAVTIRSYEFEHEYHQKLHVFIDQVERILLGLLIFLLGGSLYGGILNGLNWSLAVIAIVFVLIFRPLVARISLMGVRMKVKEKWAISFFGIKGVGSFFYLSFALNKEKFLFEEELWSFCAFLVLVSIFVHGLSAVWTMKKLTK